MRTWEIILNKKHDYGMIILINRNIIQIIDSSVKSFTRILMLVWKNRYTWNFSQYGYYVIHFCSSITCRIYHTRILVIFFYRLWHLLPPVTTRTHTNVIKHTHISFQVFLCLVRQLFPMRSSHSNPPHLYSGEWVGWDSKPTEHQTERCLYDQPLLFFFRLIYKIHLFYIKIII